MTTKDQPRFDVGALQQLAGDKVFARGEAYYRDGHVQILVLDPARVLAQVAGTEDYRTVLTGSGRTVAGECSCPAFEDWGFCKHMVATALAANAAGNDAEAEGTDALARIREYLTGKGIDALVEMIVNLAERDPALFRKLDLAATAVRADDKTLAARLRKAIDNATRTQGFIDYDEASGWAEGVDSTLDMIADLVNDGRGHLALELAERAIERIERSIEEIDDSNGHCSTLLEHARDIHLAAASAVRPDPVALARDLFAREVCGDYATFDGAAALYADVLGDEGLAEYRRLAVAAWEKLPARNSREQREFSSDYRCLADILDFFAERAGDVEARIALRAKDLSSPWSYLQLAEFCLSQGREEEALRRAEEGLWLFEDGQPDQRLVFFAVNLLLKAGRNSDAEAQLWRAFEKAPSLEVYGRLRKLGGMAAFDRAVKFLEVRIVNKELPRRFFSSDLVVEILTREKMFDAAWVAVRTHGATAGVTEALARASEATHPREALQVYAAQVDQLANAGGNRAYADATKLIVRMANLQSEPERVTYLTALKVRHGRKRNFMKLLK